MSQHDDDRSTTKDQPHPDVDEIDAGLKSPDGPGDRRPVDVVEGPVGSAKLKEPQEVEGDADLGHPPS